MSRYSKDRTGGSDIINKHNFFGMEQGSHGRFCYLRNEHLNPHFRLFISKVRYYSIFIHDVYVD